MPGGIMMWVVVAIVGIVVVLYVLRRRSRPRPVEGTDDLVASPTPRPAAAEPAVLTRDALLRGKPDLDITAWDDTPDGREGQDDPEGEADEPQPPVVDHSFIESLRRDQR